VSAKRAPDSRQPSAVLRSARERAANRAPGRRPMAAQRAARKLVQNCGPGAPPHLLISDVDEVCFKCVGTFVDPRRRAGPQMSCGKRWKMWATVWAQIHTCGKMWEPAQAPAAYVGTFVDVVWRCKCCAQICSTFLYWLSSARASKRRGFKQNGIEIPTNARLWRSGGSVVGSLRYAAHVLPVLDSGGRVLTP
jgi:hypothetical protein